MKVKVNACSDLVVKCGERKAFIKISNELGGWFDVAVHRYNGKYYFLVWYNGKLHECMPL